MGSLLEDLLARYQDAPPEHQAELAKIVVTGTAGMAWVPNPGPQTEAYHSQADCLLYGGEPGGGKSQLILGLAFNCHQRSLVMRRQYGDLERLIDDALKIHGTRDGFNGSPPPRLRLSDTQVINFRAAQRIGDEQGTMGQGRDLLGIDEATHFAESQIRFLMGWVRSEVEGQRCRTILATNPPLTAEGLWVNQMFAPWLDPVYPYPAKPGELRWVISDEEGLDEWVDGPDDVRVVNGREMRPTSRTFIPASVKDNPYYAATDYERQLDALPEPLRSQLLGGFRTAFKDDDWQVIPTAWIEEAQKRWKPDGNRDFAMTAIAVDPAGGGRDDQVIAMRHGGWFAPLSVEKGPSTADPKWALHHILQHWEDNAAIVLDVGGGYSGPLALRLTDRKIAHLDFNGSGASSARAKGSRIPFANKRAEAWTFFREALDPNQVGGSVVALPDDPELKADLAAVRYDPHALQVRGQYLIESKEQLRKRLGRSPGRGDAAVMALSVGAQAVRRQQARGFYGSSGGQQGGMPKVTIGYMSRKRHMARR